MCLRYRMDDTIPLALNKKKKDRKRNTKVVASKIIK